MSIEIIKIDLTPMQEKAEKCKILKKQHLEGICIV
jgi:hypothetical protein